MLCSPGLASSFPKYQEPILCPCGKIWREGWVCVAQTTATRSVVVRVVCQTPFSSSPLSAINMFAAVVCRDLLAPHLESNTSLFFHNVKKKNNLRTCIQISTLRKHFCNRFSLPVEQKSCYLTQWEFVCVVEGRGMSWCKKKRLWSASRPWKSALWNAWKVALLLTLQTIIKDNPSISGPATAS